MIKQFTRLIEHIIYLYKQNLEIQKQAESIFRIIKCRKDKNNESVVDVQVINKASVFTCRVKEIVTQDQLLESFSKSDIRLIVYLATEELLKPKKKIVGFEYDFTGRTLLTIKDDASKQITKLTVDKIATNINLLKELSQEDAQKSGYLMAEEQIILEKKFLILSK